MQELVKQFHEKYGHPVSTEAGICGTPTLALRRDLIAEEARETDDALYALYMIDVQPSAAASIESRRQVIENVADGLSDLLYVCFGTALSLGIDLEAHFREVHRSNMTKTPVKAKDGQKYGQGGGKGPDYEEPDHGKLLGW